METHHDVNILVVDDDERNLGVVGNMLMEKGYGISLVSNGQEALESIKNLTPNLILLDVMLPDLDGFQICKLLKEDEKTKDIPIIFLTAKTDTTDIVKSFQVGGIDYVPKPFRKEELLARVNTHIKLKQVEKSLKEALIIKDKLLLSERSLLDDTLKGSIRVLIEILSMISPVLFNHSNRLRGIVRKLTARLGIEKEWEVEIAILLSHIGCITLPPSIFAKKSRGENLSDAEHAMFLSHPAIGKKLLSNIPRLEKISESIYYQLKSYDGSGFPNDNLKEKEIPIIARILKVVNDFEALLISGKTYSQSLDLLRIDRLSYDPDILDALESVVFNVKEGYVVKSIGFNDLIIGMTLADDIADIRGVVLVSKGKEITETLKILLHNYSTSGALVEPIKVLVPVRV
jgi:response regulator RpfG family c-di-GMP phosphodiesterase